MEDYGPIFQTYLDNTAGLVRKKLNRSCCTSHPSLGSFYQTFDPPVTFHPVAITDINGFTMSNDEYDFAYLDAGVGTCQLQASQGTVAPLLTITNLSKQG